MNKLTRNFLPITIAFIISLLTSSSYADSPVMSIPSITPQAILANRASEITISAEILVPENNLEDVVVKIKKGSGWVKTGPLQDNGKNGDIASGDGIYSGRFKISPQKPGKISFKVIATDTNKNSVEGNISLEAKKKGAAFKPAKIIPISGNNQTGNLGKILKEPFIIAVENELGKPAPKVPINISVDKGEGEIITGSEAEEKKNENRAFKSKNSTRIYTDSKGRAKFRVKLGNSDKDLKINVTSPSIPGESVTFFAIVGSVDTPDLPTDLDISGNYAFIADRFSGLQIVDISNPIEPKIVNTFSQALGKNLSAQSLLVDNNICYLVNYDPNRLFVIDVNNPASIDFQKDSDSDGIPDALIKYIDLPVEDLDIPIKTLKQNQYFFILYQNRVNENGKIFIIDIDNLSYIIIDIYHIPSDLKIKDNFLYVASGESGIIPIDIKDPFSPGILYSFGEAVSSSISISGNYLYYVDYYEDKLHVVDISTPESPVEIPSIRTIEGKYADIAISGNFVYLASHEVGIQVFDISNKENIKSVGVIDTPSSAKKIKINGDYGFILDTAFGLYVVSIPTPDEKDFDNDGVIDFFDAFPQNPSETIDTDKDVTGDNADTDDDNDGYSDIEEISKGTASLNPKDFPVNIPEAGTEKIFVDSKASSGGNGSEQSPYSSITEALLAVKSAKSSGIEIKEIVVNPGTYSTDKEFFPLTLSSGIVLMGAAAANTVIDAKYSSWAININYEENVTVEGFTIKNSNAGIAANYSSFLTIKNNVIEKNEFGGISIGINSFSNKIENNIVKNNKSSGIFFFENSSVDTIKNNIINKNENYGIFIAENSTAEDISGNIITKNGIDGIQIYGSSLANSIRNNFVSENMIEGITVAANSIADDISENTVVKNQLDGIRVYYSSSVKNINNNTIEGNAFEGIALYSDATTESISGNTVTENGEDGIQISYSSSGNIMNNEISNNARVGILISTDSASENISGNTISENALSGIVVQNNSSADINKNFIRGNIYDGIFIAGNSTASIGLTGGKLKIISNGDDGIDIEPDSTATINVQNIFFKGNKDKEIEGKYQNP